MIKLTSKIMKIANELKKYLLHMTWIISLFAVTFSLYFSEILKLPPCVLCWWQRIMIYPLALIIPVGLITKDKNVDRYILTLSSFGFLIAGYQYLLTMGIIPENLSPCTNGVSCATNPILWFGFVNIPLLSFIAFSMIILLTTIYNRSKTNE